MQFHQLKGKKQRKPASRVGRGGKRGKTSGRGTKGQKARAGGKLRPEMRDIIKRLPKKRGYRFNSINDKTVVLNLKDLESHFAENDNINPETLFEKKLISRKDLKKSIKILSVGKLSKKVIISKCLISKTAKEKVESVGGTVS